MWLHQWHCHHMYFHQESPGCAQYCRKGVWKDSRCYQRLSNWWRNSTQLAGYSYPVITYGEHDVKWWQMLFCGKKNQIGQNYLDAQCYSCNGFGHFAQDCLEKIFPSETHCHYERSHFHNSCNHRDRSHSFHHRCRLGNYFDRSGSHHWPQFDRSSSNYQRHAPCFLSCHCSSSQYLSTDRYSRSYSCRDTPHHHRYNSSLTQHPSQWSHSHNYSTDCSQSSSRHSSNTPHRLHTRTTLKSKLQTATPMDPSIRRRSVFRTHSETHPQNWTSIWMF